MENQMAKKKCNTHQYFRDFPYTKGMVGPLARLRPQWTCNLPECGHYIPGNMRDPIGKLSLCNQCMKPFILDVENMKNDYPICDACSDPSRIVIPEDFDWERMETKAFIAKKENKPIEEITEAEIDRMIQLRRLNMS